jgi:hypothetical protein
MTIQKLRQIRSPLLFTVQILIGQTRLRKPVHGSVIGQRFPLIHEQLRLLSTDLYYLDGMGLLRCIHDQLYQSMSCTRLILL